MRWGAPLPAPELSLSLLPVALAASAAVATFAPPEGQTLHHILVEERDDGTVFRRFEIERTIVFRSTATGFTAEVTLIRTDQPAGEIGRMFAAGLAGLKGRTVRFQLDRAGTIVSIDDEAAVWDALCRGIEELAARTAPKRSSSKPFVAPLRALEGDQRRALLGGMIAPLIAGQIPASTDRPVTMAARGPGGASTRLDGRETIQRSESGAVLIDTVAAGTIPAQTPGGTGASVSIRTQRRIDPATGLVLQTIETRDTTLQQGSPGGVPIHDVIRKTSTLITKVS